jgi:hypothetical protein
MTNILLTGIPEVGKSVLADTTQKIAEAQYDEKIEVISLSQLVSEGAQRAFSTSPARVPFISRSQQRPSRQTAIGQAVAQLHKISNENNGTHTIVTAPMVMYLEGGIPNLTFGHQDLQQIHDTQTIDYVVTLIDDPHQIKSRLTGTDYPKNVTEILNWTALEVDVTEAILPYKRNGSMKRPRFLVIPKNYSDASLAKLLHEGAPGGDSPLVTYLAGPITRVIDDDEDSKATRTRKHRIRNRMEQFRRQLEDYTIVVNPMVIPERSVAERVGKEKYQKSTYADIAKAEGNHTKYRDINWFVGFSNVIIAHFPDDVHSSGATREIQSSDVIGKQVILIHPKKSTEVFGISSDLYYPHEDALFRDIDDARSKEGPLYDFLRGFLDPELKGPRYQGTRSVLDNMER